VISRYVRAIDYKEMAVRRRSLTAIRYAVPIKSEVELVSDRAFEYRRMLEAV